MNKSAGKEPTGTEPEQVEPPPAVVGPGSHLTLHYRVSLASGDTEVVSTFGSRPATIQMGQGLLAESLEARLLGLPEGAHQRFELPAGEAYGQRNGQLVQVFSRAMFDANTSAADGAFSAGDVVDFNGQGGERVAGVLKMIDAEQVTVDFNHPLAGQAIVFEVQLMGVL